MPVHGCFIVHYLLFYPPPPTPPYMSISTFHFLFLASGIQQVFVRVSWFHLDFFAPGLSCQPSFLIWRRYFLGSLCCLPFSSTMFCVDSLRQHRTLWHPYFNQSPHIWFIWSNSLYCSVSYVCMCQITPFHTQQFLSFYYYVLSL